MKDCFICYDKMIHSIKFNCNHEICIYCFMKLEHNMCPYCRSRMTNLTILNYSKVKPHILQRICKINDIFSFILIQLYISNPTIFTFNDLYNDIYTWNIPFNIKQIYIHDIMVMYNFIHPEKIHILVWLFIILSGLFVYRNEMFIMYYIPHRKSYYYHNYVDVGISMYPIFIITNLITLVYLIYFLFEYKKSKHFQFRERQSIKIENMIRFRRINEMSN